MSHIYVTFFLQIHEEIQSQFQILYTKHVHVHIVLVLCVVNDCSICNNIALDTVSNDSTRLCYDIRDHAVLIWF